MPRVPRRTGPSVSTAPLPQVRRPTSAPEGAFQGIDVTPIAQLAADRFEKEREKADSLVLLDADNQLDRLRTDIQTRASQRRGKDAFGVTQQADEEFRLGASKIAESLASDDQRVRFQRAVGDKGAALYTAMEEYTTREMDRFETETTLAALGNRVSEAIASPQNASMSLADLRATIEEASARRGLSDEAKGALTLEWTTKLHAGVIDAMLVAGKDQEAAEYYKSAKAEIEGSAQSQIQKALDTSSVLGEGQRRADTILGSKPNITRTDAFDLARKITDPEVRQETEQRLDIEFRRRDQAASEDYRALYGRAFEYAERGQKPPGPIWAKLEPEHKENILRFLRAEASGESIRTDPGVYYGLLNRAAGLNERGEPDPRELTKFLNEPLLAYRTALDETDFQAIVRLQTELRSRTADPVMLKAHRTALQVENSALALMGIDPNSNRGKDQKKVAIFRRAVEEQADAWKRANNKEEIPNGELQKIVDGLLIGGDDAAFHRFFDDSPDDIRKITDVPDVEQARLREDAKRLHGIEDLTDAEIILAYQARLRRLRGPLR